ncbi:unnamed protein product [Pleuronectes platessa]|uniref:Uncharacterized protein n=1 Tax=Pleuronectes platessa TaxID=8262 RepID=A0A9N7UJZ8_PLEPL|nr:unnamed protein product [Pleuronectes platessa]
MSAASDDSARTGARYSAGEPSQPSQAPRRANHPALSKPNTDPDIEEQTAESSMEEQELAKRSTRKWRQSPARRKRRSVLYTADMCEVDIYRLSSATYCYT